MTRISAGWALAPRAARWGRPPAGIDGALEVLDAEELRELTREQLFELEGSVRESAVDRLVARAAKKGVGWVPEVPGEVVVTEIVSVAEAGKRGGEAALDALLGQCEAEAVLLSGKAMPMPVQLRRSTILTPSGSPSGTKILIV